MSRKETLTVVYIVAALFASIQLISLGYHEFVMPKPGTYPDDIMHKQELMDLFLGKQLTDYNNYVIFKYSFFHLIHGANLYGVYPNEHWDFYKYSPSFAWFMAVFAYLPDWLGLSIWNLTNALVLLAGVRMLVIDDGKKTMILWFVGIELLTSLQNAQSNGLICGLLVAAFACMQRGKERWATLWIVLATFIKVYGAIGFCLFLLFPNKQKFVAYAAIWTIVVAALPLTVTSPAMLVWQYQNWLHLLQADRSAAYGISVMGWLHSWFGIEKGKEIITLAGMLLFLLPFLKVKMYANETFRLLILASLLIWVIIFNHKAESPTFIIAVTGVALWYATMERNVWRTSLFWITFVFTILSATDLFPPDVKQHFLIPYTIKVVPCILVWAAILVDIMRLRQGNGLPVAKAD